MKFGYYWSWTNWTFGFYYYHPIRNFSIKIGPLELYVKRKPDFEWELECEFFEDEDENENNDGYKKAYGK